MKEIYHHGIAGQQWGKRNGPPYPLDRKDYSPEEKKMYKKLAGKGKVEIGAGATMYRQTSNKDDETKKDGKMYVNADKKESLEKYRHMMAAGNLINTGESYVKKYQNKELLKIPSLKEQEKIERSLINDPEIKKEVIESLIKKGMNREDATKIVNGPKFKNAVGIVAGCAAVGGFNHITIPTSIVNGTLLPIAIGAGIGTIAGIDSAGTYYSKNKKLQIMAIRNQVGDVNNKKINEKFEKKLHESGYNAYRDTNDRENSVKAKASIVVTNPNKNMKIIDNHKMSKEEYGEAYAMRRVALNPKILKTIDMEDLIKDGEKQYDQAIDNYYTNRAAKKLKKETVEKIKEEDKKKKYE